MMENTTSLRKDLNQICIEIEREFFINQKTDPSGLLVKIESVLDRFLEQPESLKPKHFNKICQLMHWCILNKNACKIGSMVAKAYKILACHFSTKDNPVEIQKTNLWEDDLLFVTRRILAGEKLSDDTIIECIDAERLDILQFLHYANIEINIKDPLSSQSILTLNVVCLGKTEILKFLIKENFPIDVKFKTEFLNVKLLNSDLLIFDICKNPEQNEIAEILVPHLLRNVHAYLYLSEGNEKKISLLEVILKVSSLKKFAFYLNVLESRQEKMDVLELCCCIHNRFNEEGEIAKQYLETLEKSNKKEVLPVLGKFILTCYRQNTHPKFFAYLREYCNSEDVMWRKEITKVFLELEEKNLKSFIEDFPWQKWGYTASESSNYSCFKTYLELGVPWKSVSTQERHWYQDFKIENFHLNQKCLRPIASSEEDWNKGKRLFWNIISAHIGHRNGKRQYSISQSKIMEENYEGFCSHHPYMYKILNKALTKGCEVENFDSEGFLESFFKNILETSPKELLSLTKVGKPCSIKTGFLEISDGHAAEILFFGPYMVICDLGEIRDCSLKVYHINKEKLTEEWLEKLIEQDKGSKENFTLLLDKLVKDLECHPHQLCEVAEIGKFIRKYQSVANCEWASKEAVFYFLLLLIVFRNVASEEEWEKGVTLDKEKLNYLTSTNQEFIIPLFYSVLSVALLRFVDKEIGAIEKGEDHLKPDWEFLIKLLLDPFYISIKCFAYDERLKKVLSLIPWIELQKVLHQMPLADIERIRDLTDDQKTHGLIQQHILDSL